ncbi:TetR family transcriptional regulator [Murinocardiopsis flavida]|uniref:TetR family transcriptional regulator n=1 Tax=Murinocardiopsis flavida TaxID=645275 RepID=A0A2P8DGH2_9ACTN|nr:TetR/AcrR family transcriptional regulator [Murinocardiopsis flavida]PSK96311.1 TetR family transcriptional regulator [Murinocardiopsis flavida]
MSGAASGRTRRRGAELVDAIRAAAIEELIEVGFGRLTMEGIAKRAGTAKTSLYRRWASPRELLIDAYYEQFPQEEPSPAADDLRGDLLRSLRLMVDWMRTPSARALGTIMFERERDPEFVAAMVSRVFDARGGRFTKTVLRHYADHGVVDPARLTPVVVDIGEALVLKHSVDATALPGEEELAAIVDEAILPALGLPPSQ